MNLFADIPADLPDELCELLVNSDSVRIERIVSRGHRSAEGFWYDQESTEFVLLVSGSACLVFEGETDEVEMKPGDYLVIPAHRRHRVTCTAPDRDTVWLAIHYSGNVG